MKKIFAAAALALPLTVTAKPIAEFTVPAEQSMSQRAVTVKLELSPDNEILKTTNEGYKEVTPCASFAKRALNHSRSTSNVVEIVESQPSFAPILKTMTDALNADRLAMEACQKTKTPAPVAEYNRAKREIAAVEKQIVALKLK